MRDIISRSGYTLVELQAKDRSIDKTTIRWVLFKHLRKQGTTYKAIGKIFKRNHATVIYGVKQLEYLKDDKVVKCWIEKLETAK